MIKKLIKAQIPVMGETEKIALEAGDSWIEQEFFKSSPNFAKIISDPPVSLSLEEQNFLDQETEDLCQKIDDWKITHELKDLPKEVWIFIQQKGFMGLVINKKYGGKGFSAAAHSAIVTKIATRSLTAAVTVMVPNSLGPAELIDHYGTEDQKNYYLPRLAAGEEIPCFGLTSLYAGSDASSMIDEGVVCYGYKNKERVLGIKINASKRYITLAPVASLIGLAFKLKDPEGLLNPDNKNHPDLGISLALLSSQLEGITIGQRHYPLNIPFMNGPIEIKNCFIPLECLIGGEKYIGQGWKMLMECLSIGRSISLPAVATASAAMSSLSSFAYAQIRQQFKLSLIKFEGIQEKLARMASFSYGIEAMRQMTLKAVCSDLKPSVASAIAKYHMTEMARVIINDAMDIHGGKAIILGPKNYLARAYQGIPVSITVEGANILTRNLIIFGQGAVKSHPCLFELLNSLSSGQAVGKNLFKFAINFLKNWGVNFYLNITAGIFIKQDSEFKVLRSIRRLSLAFALATDFSVLILGGKLKRKERLSARLGDVLSYLYLTLSVLTLWNEKKIPEEKPMVLYLLKHTLYQAEEILYEFYDHFTDSKGCSWLGKFLKIQSFLWGKICHKKPSDYLAGQVVENWIACSSIRERFEKLCFIKEGSGALSDLLHFQNTQQQDLKNLEVLLSVDAWDNLF